MCFAMVLLDKCRTAFHKLYFEAVCKLEVWLRDGGSLHWEEVKRSMQLAECVTVAHVRDLPFPSPTLVCNCSCCKVLSETQCKYTQCSNHLISFV